MPMLGHGHEPDDLALVKACTTASNMAIAGQIPCPGNTPPRN